MSELTPDGGSAKVSAVAADLRVVIGQLRRRMREGVDPGEFTPSQVAALSRLESHGPATVTELARSEGVRPQSMGATVAPLEAAGLISAAADPSDGRRTILSLSQRFLDGLKAGRAAKEDWLSRAIRSQLTEEEQEQLATSLELLKRLVDVPDKPRRTP